jgi:MFS family permease
MSDNLYSHYIEPMRSFNRSARLYLWMTIINGIINSAWQLFFNFYILNSGYDRDFLGLVNAMPSTAGLVVGLFTGRISDRIGRRRSLIIGLGMMSVAMALQVTLRNPLAIAAMGFLAGMFRMLAMVSQAPLMMKLTEPKNRTLMFSLNFGLQTLAGAGGSLLGGQLPAVFGSLLHAGARSATAYQAVLLASVALGTTALIPLWMMREPESSAARQPGERDQARSSGLIGKIIRLATPQLIIGLGAAILIPYMNVFFVDRFNVPDAQLGVLFSLSSLLIGIGSLIAPRLTDLLGGRVRAVVVSQFGSLIFLVILWLSSWFPLAAAGFLLRAALMNLASPLYSAFAMEQAPEHEQGMVNSVLNIAWQVGWAVGPYISGVVQQRWGFDPLFAATGVLYALAISATWIFFHKSEAQPVLQAA